MGTIPDRIFELIVLQLDHEQTADEEKELAAWLAEKKEHRQWWESYLQIRAQANYWTGLFLPIRRRLWQK